MVVAWLEKGNKEQRKKHQFQAKDHAENQQQSLQLTGKEEKEEEENSQWRKRNKTKRLDHCAVRMRTRGTKARCLNRLMYQGFKHPDKQESNIAQKKDRERAGGRRGM